MSQKLIVLKNLCQEIEKRWQYTYGVNEIESLLMKILFFVKENPNSRPEFLEFFIDRVKRKESFPMEVIIFSMRELQWSEVKNAAKAEIKKTDDWRIISVLNEVLAVYEKEWEDAEMYEYYSKATDS